MGTYVVKLPDVGEGIAEAELVEWHVTVGDVIAEDQPIADVMTDKATVELPSPVGGTIARLGAEAGDVVAIGSDLVWIETDGAGGADGADAPAATAEAAPTQEAERPAPSEPPAAEPDGDRPTPAAEEPAAPPRLTGALAAPAVRRRAADLGIALTSVTGTGPDGRVVHGDLDRLLAERPTTGGQRPRESHPQVVDDDVEAVKVIGLRRNIAQRMQESTRRIPHFTYVEEVDVTEHRAAARRAQPPVRGRPPAADRAAAS